MRRFRLAQEQYLEFCCRHPPGFARENRRAAFAQVYKEYESALFALAEFVFREKKNL